MPHYAFPRGSMGTSNCTGIIISHPSTGDMQVKTSLPYPSKEQTMKTSYKLLTIFSISFFCQSCAESVSNKPATEQNHNHVYTQCTEPRPEICTREYNPVCARLNTGNEEKTYGNGCSACADPAVIDYRQGACEQ